MNEIELKKKLIMAHMENILDEMISIQNIKKISCNSIIIYAEAIGESSSKTNMLITCADSITIKSNQTVFLDDKIDIETKCKDC